MSLNKSLCWLTVFFTSLALMNTGEAQQAPAIVSKPEKVIIDTDIGGDIDDAFAIALALQSPELKLLGVSTVSGDTAARARRPALGPVGSEVGFLTMPRAKRSIPIGCSVCVTVRLMRKVPRIGLAGAELELPSATKLSEARWRKRNRSGRDT